MAKKKISELAMKVAKRAASKKPMSPRKFAEMRKQDIEAKKKAAKGIARAGDIAIAPSRAAEVKRSVKAQAKDTGSKRVVGQRKSKIKEKDLPMVQQQQLEFGKLKMPAQRAERQKVRDGKKSKYEDFLILKENEKSPNLTKAAIQKRIKENQAEVAKRRTTKKSYGGGMAKKTVKRQIGGKMADKPKGVGCATKGYGKAMS